MSGTGYGAYAAIDIFFDTTDLCLSFADGTGAFSCAIKIPKDAQPQQHWISARQQSTATGAQKAFTVRTDWAQFHGMNAKHTGFNPYENTINKSNVANLDILWTAPIGSAFGTQSTPAVVGGRVYIGGIDGKLHSFYKKTGGEYAGWPRRLGRFSKAPPPSAGMSSISAHTRPRKASSMPSMR